MTKRYRPGLAVAATAGALSLGAAACGGDDDANGTPEPAAEPPAEQSVEQPQAVTGGFTTLRLDSTASRILDTLGVQLEPAGAAELTDGDRFRFPITEGSVDIDTLSGRIEHDGGLRFTAGGRSIEATDLVIRPGKGIVEADVDGRRTTLLGADLRALRAPTSGTVVLPGSVTTVAPGTISALEDGLGIDLPDVDLTLGRLQVSGKT
jgi:hypothetical protein